MAAILIAEDDEQMRLFLASALRRAGYHVEAVGGGAEALAAIQGRGFDLLLADVVMPGMDGIELARRVHESFPDIRVMFITGFAAVALKAPQVGHGPARVLSKPVHLRELIREVGRVLAE